MIAYKIMSASKFDSPSHEDIAARAEQIYRQSGCIAGRDLENWVQAENELKQQLNGHGPSANGNATPKAKNGPRTQPREKQRA
jgi:hypothetical protein